MTLSLLPLVEADFDTMISQATLYPIGDDLTAPPVALCWPVKTRQDAEARSIFNMSRQRQRFLNDASVRFLKVIDTNDGSIISIARWHYYPSGYVYDRDVHWELIPEDLPRNEQPIRMNVKLHNHILATRDAKRAELQGTPGSPCWIMMHLITRPSQRGRGAAGLLINWGIQQSVADDVPAYLEAGVMGKPIYEKYGFRQVGEVVKCDLQSHGGTGEFLMANMEYRGRKASVGVVPK